MENEFLRVTVDHNGSLGLYDKESGNAFQGLNYFEDAGDCGDFWMYYPPHHNRIFTSAGCVATISIEENGPLSATIAARISMDLPAFALRPENEIHGESRRSEETRPVMITTRYTLQRGSRQVDVRLHVENTVEDHRLRVMFDTGINASFADAAGHFTVDRRPVDSNIAAQGEYWPEMQTLPQQSFVSLSDGKQGFAILNDCLTEYEAMGNAGGTLALTLMRCVRNVICTEFRSAGVFPHQKGGQSLGGHEYRYSMRPHQGNWQSADLFNAADQLNVPLRIIQTNTHGGGFLPLAQSFYRIEPKGLVLSAFKQAEDRKNFVMRIFNPSSETISGHISFRDRIETAWILNLNEERQEQLEASGERVAHVQIGSNKIMTLEFIWAPESDD